MLLSYQRQLNETWEAQGFDELPSKLCDHSLTFQPVARGSHANIDIRLGSNVRSRGHDKTLFLTIGQSELQQRQSPGQY